MFRQAIGDSDVKEDIHIGGQHFVVRHNDKFVDTPPADGFLIFRSPDLMVYQQSGHLMRYYIHKRDANLKFYKAIRNLAYKKTLEERSDSVGTESARSPVM